MPGGTGPVEPIVFPALLPAREPKFLKPREISTRCGCLREKRRAGKGEGGRMFDRTTGMTGGSAHITVI
jgi:hypothetical protein